MKRRYRLLVEIPESSRVTEDDEVLTPRIPQIVGIELAESKLLQWFKSRLALGRRRVNNACDDSAVRTSLVMEMPRKVSSEVGRALYGIAPGACEEVDYVIRHPRRIRAQQGVKTV
jgi:hypothetical protein